MSASFILKEVALIITETIDHFVKDGLIRSHSHKEVLKFESIAYFFWLFQKTDLFPEPWHKLLLDEMHDQYYSRLKKHGYNRKALQLVCNALKKRYQTYYDAFGKDNGLSRVLAKYVSFATDGAKVDWNDDDLSMPLYLNEKITLKLMEFKAIITN